MKETRPPVPFLALAQRRRSVRSYSPRAVEREAIGRCLEAARLAPSACNAQPWTFVVVEDPERRARIAEATSGGALPLNHFVGQAPVLVVVVREPAPAVARLGAALRRVPFPLMDIGIAAEHFCLQAAEEGLGTCLLGWFREGPVRALLGIPPRARPALIIAMGYPADPAPGPRVRKTLGEMSAWNRYPAGDRPAARAVPGLAAWLAVTFAAAALGGMGASGAGSFYGELVLPAWAPPGWLFAPVWSLLYTTLGLAAWLAWRAAGWRGARGPLGLYLLQLAVNALWPWLFFAWRRGALSVAGALLLWGLLLAVLRGFHGLRPLAGRLLLPCLAWVAYAAALAAAVWRLNPGRLG